MQLSIEGIPHIIAKGAEPMTLYKFTIVKDRFGSRRCFTVAAHSLMQAIGLVPVGRGERIVDYETEGGW